MANLTNAMSVDLEDWFQVSAFEKHVDKKDWDNLSHRVEKNTQKILALFDNTGIKATFFTLGWVAEKYPQLIREIVSQGHELACHGYSHVRVTEQSPKEFKEDVIRAKEILEDISGAPVIGYRAASYSIGRDNLWALSVLQDLGFKYSSSIYPVKHDHYGMPEAPRFAFHPENAPELLEIPVTTVKVGGRNFPCGGGGYFRLYPYIVSKWAINQVNREGQSAVFYFHPWEVDPGQPRPRGLGLKTRLRHYLNLNRMEARLRALLKDFQWDTVANVYLVS